MQLVSQSLRFISTAIRSGYYKDLFGSKATIDGLVQGVVVPNVGLRGAPFSILPLFFSNLPYISRLTPCTEHEMEQFEDDPLEFIRLDLALPGSGAGATADVTTRRQAAADVLQALVGSGYEAEATEIVGKWIGEGLAAYQSTKGKGGDGWKAKDSAVYLLTAVATRGGTAQVSQMVASRAS